MVEPKASPAASCHRQELLLTRAVGSVLTWQATLHVVEDGTQIYQFQERAGVVVRSVLTRA